MDFRLLVTPFNEVVHNDRTRKSVACGTLSRRHGLAWHPCLCAWGSHPAQSGRLAMAMSSLEHVPKRLNRGDSLFVANQIQESYWQEASMDGKALLGRFTQASS